MREKSVGVSSVAKAPRNLEASGERSSIVIRKLNQNIARSVRSGCQQSMQYINIVVLTFVVEQERVKRIPIEGSAAVTSTM